MTSLDEILKTIKAPEPSEPLKARILRDAVSQRDETVLPQPANDNHWKKWAAIAATLLVIAVAGMTTLRPAQEVSEAELWAETAEDLGYEDLYAWVNDEGPVEEQDQSSLMMDSLPA